MPEALALPVPLGVAEDPVDEQSEEVERGALDVLRERDERGARWWCESVARRSTSPTWCETC